MRLFILTFLCILIIFGQKAHATPDYEIKVTGRAHGWVDDPKDKPLDESLRGVLRMDGWIDVGPKSLPKGCLRVAARVSSGDRFNSEWVESSAKFDLSLRQLYVSSTCLQKITVDVGASPVRRHGVLGLSESGYVDGVNVVIDDSDHGRNWILTVGAVQNETNLLQRDLGDINHASVQVKQSLSKNVSGFVAIAKYKDSLFNRGGLTWILNQYSQWLTETGAEVLFSEERLLGGIIYTKFDLRNFETTVSASKIQPDPREGDKLGFLLKQFYGYGNNFYFETNRKLSEKVTANFRLRLGDAGTRVQAGVTVSLGKKKRP